MWIFRDRRKENATGWNGDGAQWSEAETPDTLGQHGIPAVRVHDQTGRRPDKGRKSEKYGSFLFSNRIMTNFFEIFFLLEFFPNFFFQIDNQKSTPGREGLRERRIEPSGAKDPYALESWLPEEELELWEIKSFYDRIEHPVEAPKPPPPPAITTTPATLTMPQFTYRAIQRNKTDASFLVEISGRTLNGKPQYVILPSGYGNNNNKSKWHNRFWRCLDVSSLQSIKEYLNTLTLELKREIIFKYTKEGM